MIQHIAIAVSCDFSLSAVNYMLKLGRDYQLGQAFSIYCSELEKGKTFREWGIVFQDGHTVYSEAQ